MMNFEDVTDSRVNTITLFEAITKVHPFAYFTKWAIKIGLTTNDKQLKEAFELKLESCMKSNPNLKDKLRDIKIEILKEQEEMEELWFRLNR